MLTLESYLNDGIHRDRDDIAAIERVLRETAVTINETFDASAKCWPYEIDGENKPVEQVSHSTTAMMINAIDQLCGLSANGVNRAFPFDCGNQKDSLLEKRKASAGALFKSILARKNNAKTNSGTYGVNDPLTISFISEILIRGVGKGDTKIKRSATVLVKGLLEKDPAGKDIIEFFNYAPGQNKSTPLNNAFIPLQVIRAGQALNVIDSIEVSKYIRYFEGTLHDQLSYSSIPDSRFDPAELIFCLEGLLRLSAQSVDARLFDRVLEVLEAAQNTSAHWRPSKPFLRTERGMVLFPVSVEAANSLRWSCSKLDENERFHSFSERYIALFRRFWEWLSARRVTVRIDQKKNVAGWHSDHIADPKSIQLWDTAQVVGFLLGYRRSLYTHIARTTLRLSRFNVRKPLRPKASWSNKTKELQGQRGTAGDSTPDKANLGALFEPVSSLGDHYKVYERIEKDFLDGWLKGSPQNYSMLLYGPPGTGKTTVAENIADALGFSLVTITVSDFLAAGGGDVEARAKIIFEVLEAQPNVVILFDEIDELVLDRSSKRHGEQDTVFKFMTPGMLTKINNLRRAERSIFIMATNYAYRIDPAIRRTGRIDENYLLLPPDANARIGLIKGVIEKERMQSIFDASQINGRLEDRLKMNSFFLGYSDIRAVMRRISRKSPHKDSAFDQLCQELLMAGRTTTLKLYNVAFGETDNEAVEREFYPLVHMSSLELISETQVGSADGNDFAEEARKKLKGVLDNSPLWSTPDETSVEVGANGNNKVGKVRFKNPEELRVEAKQHIDSVQ